MPQIARRHLAFRPSKTGPWCSRRTPAYCHRNICMGLQHCFHGNAPSAMLGCSSHKLPFCCKETLLQCEPTELSYHAFFSGVRVSGPCSDDLAPSWYFMLHSNRPASNHVCTLKHEDQGDCMRLSPCIHGRQVQRVSAALLC